MGKYMKYVYFDMKCTVYVCERNTSPFCPEGPVVNAGTWQLQ